MHGRHNEGKMLLSNDLDKRTVTAQAGRWVPSLSTCADKTTIEISILQNFTNLCKNVQL